MQTQLPNTKNRMLDDHLTRIYTDLFGIFNVSGDSMGVAENDIGNLTFSATPTQAECEALRDKCELLAADMRTLFASLSARGLI